MVATDILTKLSDFFLIIYNFPDQKKYIMSDLVAASGVNSRPFHSFSKTDKFSINFPSSIKYR